MTSVGTADRSRVRAPDARVWRDVTPRAGRAVLVLAVVAAAAAGVVATAPADAATAAALAGDDLTRLMRFMALIKAMLSLGAVAATLWRLGVPVGPLRLLAYALACGAAVAGPGLIWTMAHVALGALLLHGGLIACGVLLWRDPAVAGRLEAMLARRRAATRASARD